MGKMDKMDKMDQMDNKNHKGSIRPVIEAHVREPEAGAKQKP